MSSLYDNPSTTAPVELPPSMQLLRLIQGYQISQIVGTVARLGLADLLSAGSQSSGQLAGVTGADPDGLLRLLRAAVTAGLITEVEQDRFMLTPVGACLATEAQPTSVRDYAIMVTTPGHWLPYGQLFDVVMTGRPSASTALGMPIWDYYKEHPEEDALFARAMGNLSTIISMEVVACYDVSRFARIVDVGGSQGVLLTALLESAPEATGVLFDRHEVIAEAAAMFAVRGLEKRVELLSGDFFTEVPPGGDLYVLKSVLHDWDDAHALRILTTCHRAAKPDSTLLVVEGVVPSEPKPSLFHLVNLAMLVQVGGRERTREQYQALLEAAGYRLERVIPPRPGSYFGFSLFEAHRC
jgi:hypothetical protein